MRRRGGRRAALVRPAGGVARRADGAAGGVERRRVKRLLHVRREVPGRIGVAGVDGAADGTARRPGRSGGAPGPRRPGRRGGRHAAGSLDGGGGGGGDLRARDPGRPLADPTAEASRADVATLAGRCRNRI